MSHPLVHPKLLAQLADFFPASCAIQQATITQSASGSPTETWATVAGLDAIPCNDSAKSGREVRLPNETYAVTANLIVLRGSYPTITARMRAIVGALTYDILDVNIDSQSLSTYLSVRIVSL